MAMKRGPMGTDMTMVSVTEDRLSALKWMRARLAEQADVCGDERSLGLLMTRLQSVMVEIAELAPSAQPWPAVQIAERPAKRRRGVSGQDSVGEAGQGVAAAT